MKTDWIYKVLLKAHDEPSLVDQKALSDMDIIEINDHEYHLIHENRSYHIRVLSIDLQTKEIQIEINGHLYEMDVLHPLDVLIESMGLNSAVSDHLEDIRAPMPGLVLEVSISDHQTVSKGDPLIILEAMKMENAIKAPADGIIQKVHVQKGDAVEKGALLISFE